MKKEKLLKYLSFGSVVLVIPILAGATVLEKIYGTAFALEHIYTALPMLLLWAAAAFFSLLYLLHRKIYKRPAVFGLHLSFLLIIAGAGITHRSGVQGRIHLRQDETPSGTFTRSDGKREQLPFSVALKEFRLEYYTGTSAPADYISTITIDDGGRRHEGSVSMNRIFAYRHYRFYQSGYDADGKGSTLSISHDPCGIAVTYTGYAWLLLSIIAFFFDRHSTFRRLLSHPSLQRTGIIVLLLCGWAAPSLAADTRTVPPALPRETAERFGELYIYYNDRICPLQTLARDFTLKLYGKSRYKGLTPEQVLTGWLFFYDDWKHEPFLKIKGEEVRRMLDITGQYARLTDFTDVTGYKLEEGLRRTGNDRRDIDAANEKFNLASMLCTGSLLKIYPYCYPETGEVVWYSLADRPAENMPYDQWLFIRGSMDLAAEKIALQDYKGAADLLGKIKKYQSGEARTVIPSDIRFKAEKIYHRSNINRPLAMGCLTAGMLLFLLFCTVPAFRQNGNRWFCLLDILLGGIFVYLTGQLVLRGYVSGHIPLSNGFETMQFIAWCSILFSLGGKRRFRMALPFGFLVCGVSLLVSMMGESSPRITRLMPVLQSPLLSIHVSVIMMAYTLLAFTMLNGITALVLRWNRKRENLREIEYLQTVSRIILYPAVFLLAAGIFIGAVWANVSWGRYWGWDPKEVWALITLLVYSGALHTESLPLFRRPVFFHLFCIFAFFTMLITYFGVNLIFGGIYT